MMSMNLYWWKRLNEEGCDAWMSEYDFENVYDDDYDDDDAERIMEMTKVNCPWLYLIFVEIAYSLKVFVAL